MEEISVKHEAVYLPERGVESGIELNVKVKAEFESTTGQISTDKNDYAEMQNEYNDALETIKREAKSEIRDGQKGDERESNKDKLAADMKDETLLTSEFIIKGNYDEQNASGSIPSERLIPQTHLENEQFKCLTNRRVLHSAERLFKCDICSKLFRHKDSASEHLKTHTVEKLTFECNTCQKIFARKSSLQDHILVHATEKPFKCDVCQKDFTRKSSLQDHTLLHSTEKQFKCDVCPKRFYNKDYVRKHMKTHSVAKELKKFKCYTCQKDFTRKTYLQQHVLLHSAEKQFKCDLCSKRFHHKDYVRRHMRTHSREKQFKCKVCQNDYSRKSYLWQHMRLHSAGKQCRRKSVDKKRTDRGVV